MPEQACPDCKGTDTEEDSHTGDVVCRACGLVFGVLIDTGTEWRTFANDDKDKADPSRISGPANHLLADVYGGTVIGNGNSATGGEGASAMSRRQQRVAGNSSDRSLLQAFKRIGLMADRTDLPMVAKKRAEELYASIYHTRALRGRPIEGVIAASLYIACKEEGVARTFKEICAGTTVCKKELGKCYKQALKALPHLSSTISAASTSDFMSRFCSKLGLPIKVITCCSAVSRTAQQQGICAGKCPTSVAAASIFTVCQLVAKSNDPIAIPDIKDIAACTGVTEGTVRNAAKDLLPHRKMLVPSDCTWYKMIE